jgi:hypothetical protein
VFEYRLELADGSPVEPQPFVMITPTWAAGDRIFLSPKLHYRVLDVRGRVLVVEPDERT